jgi:hypothetical protein
MKIFLAGSRTVSKITLNIENRLFGIYKKGYTILVGDASGADAAIQHFFAQLGYRNVTVYASNGKARNNLGNWRVETISVPNYTKGFDFYTMKDKAMANDACYGFMIWDGKSKGTFTNIVNLLNYKKKALVYLTPQKTFLCIDSMDKLRSLSNIC